MQSYVANSPVPILHYQRSHMKFFDSIIREYATGGHYDISGAVNRRKGPKPWFKPSDNRLYELKITTFLADWFLIFSDFDVQDVFMDEKLEN